MRGLAVQARVIGAIIMRELHTRYGRENVGYLWLVGEPMLLASVIGLLHSGGGHTAYGGDITPVPFAVLGYITFIMFRGIVNRSEGGVEANAPLLYHRMVTVMDITIARAVLEFAGCFLTLLVLMSIIIMLGLGHIPARPLMLLAAWGYMFWYALGHSLIVTGISYENRTVGRLVHPYSYFMIALSASFFQVEWMPHPFRELLTYVPLTSIFELARYGQFEATNLNYFFPLYLTASCMILTWVGLVCVKLMQSKIHLN